MINIESIDNYHIRDTYRFYLDGKNFGQDLSKFGYFTLKNNRDIYLLDSITINFINDHRIIENK